MANVYSGTITINGNTTAVEWQGGAGIFTVHGTFGSATIKLQSSIDLGVTWADVENVVLSTSGEKGFALDHRQIRINTAGGSGTSVTYKVGKIPIASIF
jgi:hypothetical protein